jgi:hypothetical protein
MRRIAPGLRFLGRPRHGRPSGKVLPALAVTTGAAILVAAVILVGGWSSSSTRPGTAPRPRPTASAPADASSTSTSLDPDGGLPLLATPTAQAPLRVIEIGDSLGIDLGLQLRAQLDATGVVDTTVLAQGDSGLCNTTYFDWPGQLAVDLDTYHPEFVVVFVGANDDQGMYVNGTGVAPGTLAWKVAYAGRVDMILEEAERAGARVVWVGMPPMEDPDLDAAVQVENAIFGQEVSKYPGTLYVASTTTLGTSLGGYQSTAADGEGNVIATRTPDGVHLTSAGAGLLAASVIHALDTRWRLSLVAG